jgi:hypothetical protein
MGPSSGAAGPPEALAIDGRRDARVAAALDAGWARVAERGGIDYEPSAVEELRCPPFRFLHLPGRLRRPGASVAPPRGLLRPHAPCPFDGPAVYALREVLRFRRAERTYHLIANRFPVRPLHFLAVRSADAPADLLPQCLLGPEEIEDALLIARAVGPPYRFFFNSNTGADGSDSGSSVNHWHFQLFPDRGDLLEGSPAGALETAGSIPGWDVPHRLHASADAGALARRVWADVERVIALDVAFTVIVRPCDDDRLAAAFVARAPVEPIAPPGVEGAGALPARFGGFELTGSVVVHERPLFEWARKHPRQAAALARERLRRGTRGV